MLRVVDVIETLTPGQHWPSELRDGSFESIWEMS